MTCMGANKRVALSSTFGVRAKPENPSMHLSAEPHPRPHCSNACVKNATKLIVFLQHGAFSFAIAFSPLPSPCSTSQFSFGRTVRSLLPDGLCLAAAESRCQMLECSFPSWQGGSVVAFLAHGLAHSLTGSCGAAFGGSFRGELLWAR